jgi:hypothetical protein
VTGRRYLLALAPVAGLLAIVAACSFPDVMFAPPGGGGADGGGAAGDGAVPVDAAPLPDGAIVSGDAGTKITEAGCQDPFDCDLDQDRNKLFDAGPDAPYDCDDLDSRAKHGQDFLDQPGVDPTNGDWNCDGRVTKYYPTKVSCSGLLGGDTCKLVKGFTGDPPCGEFGDFIYCTTDLLGSCVQDHVDKNTIKQACQ